MSKMPRVRQDTSRSSKYQFKLIEISSSDDFLSSFDNDRAISSILDPYQYNEEVELLKDQLKEAFWILAKDICTSKQYQMIRLLADGYTQQDIANIRNTNQSSITKGLNGSQWYRHRDGKPIKIGHKYGGAIPKLKKAIENSPIFQELFQKIAEARANEGISFNKRELPPLAQIIPIGMRSASPSGSLQSSAIPINSKKPVINKRRKNGSGTIYFDNETKKYRVKIKGKCCGRYKTREEAEKRLQEVLTAAIPNYLSIKDH